MATLMVVLLGSLSFFRIPMDLMPDTSVPTMSVITNYPGSSPKEIERLITRPLEGALSGLEGLKLITSTSNSNRSVIRLVFDWGSDIDDRQQRVREVISRSERQLPKDTDKPNVRRFDPNDLPVLVYGITSTHLDPVELTRQIDDAVSSSLSRLDGVGNVDSWGGSYEEVEVMVDLKKLKAHKLTLTDLSNAIKKQNFSLSVGKVKTGLKSQNLRVSMEPNSPHRLRQLVIKTLDTGIILLKDVADIKQQTAKLWADTYVDGTKGLRLAVFKVPGANTVEMAKEVKAVISNFDQRSSDIQFTEIFNSATYIENSISNVNRSVLYGGLLATFVLIVFLRNLRSAIVVGVSIPVSILATFSLMESYGISLNLMTIGGLSLGIGMLVDNAIVVLENIVRLHQKGERLDLAAAKGGQEVQASILASTITTLIVFLPVLFMDGITSMLFKDLTIVVAFSMIVSLLTAILLIPSLTALFLKGEQQSKAQAQNPVWHHLNVFFENIEGLYVKVLASSLRARAWTLTLCCLLLVSALMLIPKIRVEFMPSADSDQLRLTAFMAKGTPYETLKKNMLNIIHILKSEFPQIKHSVSYLKDTDDNDRAWFQLCLLPSGEREVTAREMLKQIKARCSALAGVRIHGRLPRSPFTPKLPNSSGAIANVEIRGYDLKLFESTAEQIKTNLETIPGVDEVIIPFQSLNREKVIRIDRIKTSELGLSPQHIAQEIKTVNSGLKAGKITQGGLEYPIQIRTHDQHSRNSDDILGLTVYNRFDEPILIDNLVKLQEEDGPNRIDRNNRQRILTLSLDLDEEFNVNSLLGELTARINEIPCPPGFTLNLGGSYQQQIESRRELMISLALVVVLVYMVMAAQFESLKHPFIIMISVPLAAIGVLWTLFLTDTSFNTQSNMGCVMLAGIVVNNAILLVDQANKLLRSNMAPKEAIVEAGRRRLRPILMTTSTTVLGLFPLALGLGDGGEAQAPMARAVMGGLISSTMITLVLIPIIYTFTERRSPKPQ